MSGGDLSLEILAADKSDLKTILELQYLAYQSEADLFGTRDIPPLKQTLEEVTEEYSKGLILKLVDDQQAIIGSVRAYENDGTVYIGKLMVHPSERGKGYGSQLLRTIEEHFPGKRYELFTSTRSLDNIRLYKRSGYKVFAQKKITGELEFVYMEKTGSTGNPWKDIPLDDYENHMSLDSVNQLQTLNLIMKEQFSSYPVCDVMILGVAGGNGLEHIDPAKYKTVYGIDINEEYLKAVQDRFKDLGGILHCIRLDLTTEMERLPRSEFVIADLLIEYIGYEVFGKAVMQISPVYVSCVIQINTDEENWVSDSPYLHSFDRLDEVHHQMEEDALVRTMKEIGYNKLSGRSYPLPNGKALVRIDFGR